MQDIKHLESVGLDHDSLKAAFTKDEANLDPKVKALLETHRFRIQDALRRSIQMAPHYKAIDDITQAALRNVPSILARSLIEGRVPEKDIPARMKALGLENMLVPVRSDTGPVLGEDGKPKLCLDLQIMEENFIPLVAAYRNIRLAKLMGDRNTFPRYKYSPPRLTEKTILQCEIMTSRVARITADMGDAEVDKQGARYMLDYGWSLTFAVEPWFKEEYETTEDGKVVTRIQREGARWCNPHPTRIDYDRAFPLHTINTDTGVSWALYWDAVRWKSIKNEELYWNVDQVNYGGYGSFMGSPAWALYQDLYPCQLKFPSIPSDTTRDNDRASELYRYSEKDLEAGVTKITMVEKIIPKQVGLGSYNHPVWMRFIYADTGTIIFAEPFAYVPAYAMQCDLDANQVTPSSLALELSPYQQQLGLFLRQHAQAVRKNLTRIAFINTNQISPESLQTLKKIGSAVHTDNMTVIPYSRGELAAMGQELGQAVTELKFAHLPTNDIESHVRMLLGVVERMLGYSAQEIGAAASHEQSATEVNITAGNSSVRLDFIGAGIDAGIAAKKRAIVEGLMAYGSDDVFAEVTNLTDERRKALEDLGFEIEAYGKAQTAGVKGKKHALKIDVFVSERDGLNRLNDSKVGVAMLQALGIAMGNPVIVQAVGPDQLVRLADYVYRMLGLPEDFRLRTIGVSDAARQGAINPEEVKKAILQAVAASQQQTLEQAAQLGAKQLEAVVVPISQQMQQLGAAVEALVQRGTAADQAIQQLAQSDQAMAAAIGEIRQAIEQLGISTNEVIQQQRATSGVIAGAAAGAVGPEQ